MMKAVKKITLIGVVVVIFGAGIILSGIFTGPTVQGKDLQQQVNPTITKTIPGENVNVYLGTFGNITFNASLPESPSTLPVYTGVFGPGGLIDESNGSSMGDGINVPMGTDAYEMAVRDLDTYGGVPPDAIPSGVTTNYAELVNRTTYEVVKRYAEDTMVTFTRRINGRYVMGDTDIIRVSLGDNGRLIWIYKEWRNYTYAGDVSVIPAGRAIEKLENGDTINQYLPAQNDVSIYNITLGYYVKGLEDPVTKLEPIWIFSGDTTRGSRVAFYVYARQFANFTATPTTGTATQSVTFTDTSDASPTRWLWDFGDGTNATAQNVTHVYNVSGTYNVTLKAWNDLGSDTISRQYTVNDLPATTTATPTPTPTPPELYPNSKWLTENTTVFADNSYYATIHGVDFYRNSFFAIIGNGLYNITDPAYTWTEASAYPSGGLRYTLQQLKVYNCTPPGSDNCTDYWYPPTVRDSNWQWVITDGLGEDAYQTSYGGNSDAGLLENGLGASTNHCDGTYYLWYGNVTAAYTTRWGRTDWLVPTYENATYLVNLTEIWTDTPEC